jgi:ubiquinone/menaquinone biosynthesis C-methylase UbiE
MNIKWHDRFTEQARWTKSLRAYLLNKLSINQDSIILEVGSGTGAIISEMVHGQSSSIHGIDIDFTHSSFAIRNVPESRISNADVYDLPYAANTFNLIYCHYFLLWLKYPHKALAEIRRTLKPGGVFLAFAEPDYLSRADYPAELIKLGELQTSSLIKQGVNPMIGRQLPSLVAELGFENVLHGASGFERRAGELPDWWESEWNVLESDINNEINSEELKKYKDLDYKNWLNGHRVLMVPTFYLSCIKPLKS